MTRRTRIVLRIVALVPLFVLGFWLNWTLSQREAKYRDGTGHAAEVRTIMEEFRTYYHGRTNYPAMSFEELRAKGVLSAATAEGIARGRYVYHPFTPETDDQAVVLRLGWPLVGEYFYKRELVATPQVDAGRP